MQPANMDKLQQNVAAAGEAALAKRRFVTSIDILIGVGWLAEVDVERWRQGRVDYLERVVKANLKKISTAMKLFRRWARASGLVQSETGYVARTRDRRPLRFSKSGQFGIERAYRTHWVSPRLAEDKRRRLAEHAKPEERAGRAAADDATIGEATG